MMNKICEKSQHVTRSLLTKTIGGNKLEMLSITEKAHPSEVAQRKGVVITAR